MRKVNPLRQLPMTKEGYGTMKSLRRETSH